MNTGRVLAAVNRRNAILDKLAKNPGVIYSYQEIKDEFGLSTYMLKTDMQFVTTKDANVIFHGGKIYYNVSEAETPIIHEVKMPERYGPMQNTDGLSDPTAGFAIKNLEPDASRGMIFPRSGDVWDVKRANTNDADKYTILAVNKDKQVATCIKYSKEELVDTCDICMYTKPLKYFVGNTRCWGMPLSYMTRIKERIGAFLDIPPVEKIVEVEKVVEKPSAKVAAVTTGLFTQAEVDLMLMKQKAEIYERCFNAITNR